MHVRNNSGCRNPIAISQDRCKARSSVDRGILADSIAEFAYLDSDALAVTLTAIVAVVTLFRGQQVFYDLAIIHRKMPYDPTRAPKLRIVSTALTLHYQILGMCVSRHADALGRVNRNKARSHCSTNESTVNVWGQEREPSTWQSRHLMLRSNTGGEQKRCQYQDSATGLFI
jgi:hypothetical protein